MTIYSTSALRSVALYSQHLHSPYARESTPSIDNLYHVINQIGCVQIDTLHMVQRSQYLVLWSRLGSYKPDALDRLTFGPDRSLFEGWEHAASLIPLTEFRYQFPRQRNLREHPNTGYNRWLSELVQKDFVPQVLERIRREGALKVSNFEPDGFKGGGWWNWRPAKVALEYLYHIGDLMIADRVKFQRLYDLTGRILPEWVETSEPTSEERDRFWVERGAKALGVCTTRQTGDYTWMKVTKSRPAVESLLQDGILHPVRGKLSDGSTGDLIIHRENLPILEQAADGALQAERTTFLSPFDSLFWAARRDEMFWGFHKTLEAYLPANKRVFGYFCLPILHKDRLVGRFDPKLERKTGTLILRALYLEPGIKLDEELILDTAHAMRDFLTFHEANNLIIECSQPVAFGRNLLKEL
jgi:uncharacterized protein YcaQ